MLILLLLLVAFIFTILSIIPHPQVPGWLLPVAVLIIIVILAIGSAGTLNLQTG